MQCDSNEVICACGRSWWLGAENPEKRDNVRRPRGKVASVGWLVTILSLIIPTVQNMT